MPLCEGLPDGPCPGKRNDSSVKLGEGDLMLCHECDQVRFQGFVAAQKKAMEPKSVQNEKKAVQSENAKKAVASVSAEGNSRGSNSCSVYVNELLSYAMFYRDRVSAENLRKVVIGFYSATEINCAKKLLVNTFSSDLTDCPLKAERRRSNTRGINEIEFEDIIGICDYLDQRSKLSSITVAAVNMERLPKYGPEEINLCSLADKQKELEANIIGVSAHVNELEAGCSTTSVEQLKTELSDSVNLAFVSIQDKITTLTDICSQFCSSVNSHTNTVGPRRLSVATSPSISSNRPTTVVDRSRNVVLYGVEDSRERDSWKNTVLSALQTAAGRAVEIEDAFRIGKPANGKTRPVLVKLRSVWDKRTVLGGTWRLASADGYERIFISPDEPTDARRRRTMDRLMKKASEQGKHVSVENGSLSIDDVLVFTLEHGFIRNRNG